MGKRPGGYIEQPIRSYRDSHQLQDKLQSGNLTTQSYSSYTIVEVDANPDIWERLHEV